MLTIYYAHPMSLYNTPQEQRDIEMLVKLGFQVINPAEQKHQDAIKNIGKSAIMEYFCELVMRCDALAFRAFPDNSIGSGIADEIAAAYRKKLPIIELPSNNIARRFLTIEETVNMLKDLGQR